jgi:hypothetical protein
MAKAPNTIPLNGLPATQLSALTESTNATAMPAMSLVESRQPARHATSRAARIRCHAIANKRHVLAVSARPARITSAEGIAGPREHGECQAVVIDVPWASHHRSRTIAAGKAAPAAMLAAIAAGIPAPDPDFRAGVTAIARQTSCFQGDAAAGRHDAPFT